MKNIRFIQYYIRLKYAQNILKQDFLTYIF